MLLLRGRPFLQINLGYVLMIAFWCLLYPAMCFYIPLFVLCMGSGLYWVHRTGHTLLWRPWFEAHVLGHHIKQYPSKDFASKEDEGYRHNQHDPYRLNTNAYMAVAFLILFLFQCCFALRDRELCYLVALTFFMLYVEDHLHVWVHTRAPAWIADKEWFRYIVVQHHAHHTGKMQENYAVLSLWLDFLFGTLKNV